MLDPVVEAADEKRQAEVVNAKVQVVSPGVNFRQARFQRLYFQVWFLRFACVYVCNSIVVFLALKPSAFVTRQVFVPVLKILRGVFGYGEARGQNERVEEKNDPVAGAEYEQRVEGGGAAVVNLPHHQVDDGGGVEGAAQNRHRRRLATVVQVGQAEVGVGNAVPSHVDERKGQVQEVGGRRLADRAQQVAHHDHDDHGGPGHPPALHVVQAAGEQAEYGRRGRGYGEDQVEFFGLVRALRRCGGCRVAVLGEVALLHQHRVNFRPSHEHAAEGQSFEDHHEEGQ